MKLSTLAGYNRDNKPLISIAHEEWLRAGSKFTDEALIWGMQELRKVDRSRSGHFSASALGSCGRRQQFTYMGLEQLPDALKTLGIFAQGDFMHLRWQMAGLSAGWLAEAEVPLPTNKWGMRGTMDGLGINDEVVEFKSINDRGFQMLPREGKPDHVYQVGTYLLVTGKPRGILLYENKNTSEYKEIVVTRDEETMEKIKARISYLQSHTLRGELLPMLDKCEAQEGFLYNSCPYRTVCPSMVDMNRGEV